MGYRFTKNGQRVHRSSTKSSKVLYESTYFLPPLYAIPSEARMLSNVERANELSGNGRPYGATIERTCGRRIGGPDLGAN